jgi:hypothetical protein
MPATAHDRHLANPFDPAEALARSAELLRDLKEQFGNFGLAAAAYNAGPRRVRAWLGGARQLPGETLAYVRIVTGRTAAEWARGTASLENAVPNDVPCPTFANAARGARVSRVRPRQQATGEWVVQLFGDRSEAKVLSNYRRLQERHSALLGDARAVVVRATGSNGITVWNRLRIVAPERRAAQNLCSQLRSAGETCIVQQN